MTLILDAEHVYRYTVCALITVEAARLCYWVAQRALARTKLADETERLRLQVNRMEQLLTPPPTE